MSCPMISPDYGFFVGAVDNVILGIHNLAFPGFVSEVRAEKPFKWLWLANQYLISNGSID